MGDDLFEKKGGTDGQSQDTNRRLLDAIRNFDLSQIELPDLSTRPVENSNSSRAGLHCDPYNPDSAEQARFRAYYEEHWPEYRDQAVQDLSSSLITKEPLARIPLKDGRVLEFRAGDYRDADNICTRDHTSYSVNATAIGKESSSFFRIASFADSPLEPVGYYFVKKYYESDEHSVYQNHEGQRYVGEVKFAYVSDSHRGQHLGAIMSAFASLDIIDDPEVQILNRQVANDKVNTFLRSLGFQPSGTATYGYDNYMIDLTQDRAGVRKIFQNYIDQRSSTNS